MRIVAAERLGQELGIEDGDALTQCCCSNRRRRGRRRKEASPRRLLVEATDDFVVSKTFNFSHSASGGVVASVDVCKPFW